MDITDRIRQDSQRSTEELERDIAAERAHVAELLSALEERVSPGELLNRVIGYSKDSGREFATNLSHSVRANPVPTLLTAAGMLWLYAARDRPVDRDVTAGVDDEPGLRDKLSDRMDRAREKMGDARDSTRRQAHRASEGFSRMLDENPVAVGALGIAAGAILGAVLPSTDAEDRWMGDMRDRVADRLKSGAHDLAQPQPNRADGAGRPTGSAPLH